MLFDTFQLRSLSLANRTVMAPMTRSRAVNANSPNLLMAEYYRQRASAGSRESFDDLDKERDRPANALVTLERCGVAVCRAGCAKVDNVGRYGGGRDRLRVGQLKSAVEDHCLLVLGSCRPHHRGQRVQSPVT